MHGGGFNMDYGLLHLQLATPLTVLAFILLMIFLLNKLFSTVLRLWIRGKKTSGKYETKWAFIKELERMQSDFQHKLDGAKKMWWNPPFCPGWGFQSREEWFFKNGNNWKKRCIINRRCCNRILHPLNNVLTNSPNSYPQVSERLLN